MALRQRGLRWVGLCPFHDDRHPSFDVSPVHQSWRCWVCGVGGDAIDWVRLTENCTTVEAIRRLEGLPAEPVAPKLADSDPFASRVQRHRAYRALLAAASLLPEHREGLKRRGLTDSFIDAAGYASLPSGSRAALLEQMKQAAGDVRGVPGVSRQIKGARWRLDGSPGLLIPVRDRQGRVQACQIRTDGATRYQWLSSAPRVPNWTGTSPGTPFHVAGHKYIRASATWWVTEGPLKADVASAFLERPVMGIPGVALWTRLGRALSAWRPRTIILAFDQDPVQETRERVAEAQNQLGALLAEAGVRVYIAHWSDGPKGIDDALAAQTPLKLLPWKPANGGAV